jgi:hypothetical protein
MAGFFRMTGTTGAGYTEDYSGEFKNPASRFLRYPKKDRVNNGAVPG